MTEEVAALQIRLEATTAKLERALRRGEQKLNSTARSMEARAGRLDNRLSSVGSRFGGKAFNSRIQQAGFQIGDFAVQVAGGTSAITALTQQGSQLAGAFGPLGAVLGAVGAVAGALAVSLLDTSEASSDASKSVDNMGSSLSSAQSSFSALISAAVAYQDAIRAAGDESVATANKVVASTRREFDARKRLLNLDVVQLQDDIRATRDRRSALIESLTELESGTARADEAATRRGALGPGLDDPALRRERLLEARPESVTSSGLTVREQTQQSEQLRREIVRIGAEAVIAETQLEKMSDALSASFEDLAAADSKSGSSGGGAARRATRKSGESDIFGNSAERIRERIRELRNEREQVGLNERATTMLRAAFEREKLERELVNAAQRDGIAATPEEIAIAQALASEVEMLTIAIYDEKEAIEAANEAAKQAKKDQEDLAKSIGATANKFIQAVQSAESFEDALKKVGLQLLELAANAVIGQGPLGGAFNRLIGSSGDGIIGLLNPSPSVSSGAPLSVGSLYANGGVFSRGAEITKFANGGVVSSPTAFPMVNGTGLMGEAGPEAIMPLTRGPGGKLGVMASGGGSPVVVNINNTSGAEITAQQNGPNLELLVEQAVSNSISKGGRVHKAIRQTYQLSQPTTRR